MTEMNTVCNCHGMIYLDCPNYGASRRKEAMTTPSPESIERANKALPCLTPVICKGGHHENCQTRHIPAVALTIDEAVREERERALYKLIDEARQYPLLWQIEEWLMSKRQPPASGDGTQEEGVGEA